MKPRPENNTEESEKEPRGSEVNGNCEETNRKLGKKQKKKQNK